MSRSPYAVLPPSDVARPVFAHRAEIADAFEHHGEHGLALVLRDLYAPRFEHRASTSAEVRLLREALAVEVEDGVAYWRARLSDEDADA